MSREHRPLEAHLTLHITAHATGMRLCFPSEWERETFKGHIQTMLKTYPVELHAYALMDNHVHVLVTGREYEAIAHFMKHLLATHAKSLNRTQSHQGQLWRDRYHSVLVETDTHALHSCLYIDANPWRAFVVEHPSESSWTSHNELITGAHASFVTPHPVLLDLGSEQKWRLRYQEIMAEYLKRGSRSCCPGRFKPCADPLTGLKLSCWGAGVLA